MNKIGLEEVIKSHIIASSNNMYTSIPCVVLTVHGELSNQKVDVQPVINTFYQDGTDEEHPPILGVPVIFPASRTSMLSFPINVGDTVLCVFSQRGIDNFKIGSGSPTVPTDYRSHNKKDAIAIPGLFPFSKALNNPSKRNLAHSTRDAVLTHNIGTSGECEVRLKENGDIQLNTPNNKVIVNCKDAVVNSTTVDINATSMTVDVANTTWTGNLNMSGTYVLDGITMNTHKHTGVMAGPATTGTPTN
jgi:phage baseplate assembly protein gpV